MTLITRCSLRLREVINLIFISLNREGAWRKCFSVKEACCKCIRRVWLYKRGYHNLYIEEEQTTQWPKEKVQKDKQQVPFFPSETHELYSYSLLQKKMSHNGRSAGRAARTTYIFDPTKSYFNKVSVDAATMFKLHFGNVLILWYCFIFNMKHVRDITLW